MAWHAIIKASATPKKQCRDAAIICLTFYRSVIDLKRSQSGSDPCRIGSEGERLYGKRQTIGQFTIRPVDPNAPPLGPVIKPFSAKSRIWNSPSSLER